MEAGEGSRMRGKGRGASGGGRPGSQETKEGKKGATDTAAREGEAAAAGGGGGGGETAMVQISAEELALLREQTELLHEMEKEYNAVLNQLQSLEGEKMRSIEMSFKEQAARTEAHKSAALSLVESMKMELDFANETLHSTNIPQLQEENLMLQQQVGHLKADLAFTRGLVMKFERGRLRHPSSSRGGRSSERGESGRQEEQKETSERQEIDEEEVKPVGDEGAVRAIEGSCKKQGMEKEAEERGDSDKPLAAGEAADNLMEEAVADTATTPALITSAEMPSQGGSLALSPLEASLHSALELLLGMRVLIPNEAREGRMMFTVEDDHTGLKFRFGRTDEMEESQNASGPPSSERNFLEVLSIGSMADHAPHFMQMDEDDECALFSDQSFPSMFVELILAKHNMKVQNIGEGPK